MYFNILSLSTIVLCMIGVCKSEQEYQNIKIEDIIIDSFDKTLLDEDTFEFSVNYNSDSANTLNIRADIMKDIDEEVFLKMKVYGRALGHYNMPTGVSFDINVCSNKLRDHFFKTFFVAMGWDKECPPKKGTYEARDFDPNFGGLPLHFLPGFRLMIDFDLYTKTTSFLKGKAYVQIA